MNRNTSAICRRQVIDPSGTAVPIRKNEEKPFVPLFESAFQAYNGRVG